MSVPCDSYLLRKSVVIAHSEQTPRFLWCVGGHRWKCPEKGNSARTHLPAATARHSIPSRTGDEQVPSRNNREDNSSPFHRYELVTIDIRASHPKQDAPYL